MGNPVLRTQFGEVELRPVAPPRGAPEGMQVYALLPDLEDLLGVPGFGLRNPILISRKVSRQFAAVRDPAISLH